MTMKPEEKGEKLHRRGISLLLKTAHSENLCMWKTKTTPNVEGRAGDEERKKRNP